MDRLRPLGVVFHQNSRRVIIFPDGKHTVGPSVVLSIVIVFYIVQDWVMATPTSLRLLGNQRALEPPSLTHSPKKLRASRGMLPRLALASPVRARESLISDDIEDLFAIAIEIHRNLGTRYNAPPPAL